MNLFKENIHCFLLCDGFWFELFYEEDGRSIATNRFYRQLFFWGGGKYGQAKVVISRVIFSAAGRSKE